MVPNFLARKRNYYLKIKHLLDVPLSKKELVQAIVNSPFCDPLAATYLSLGMVLFLQVSTDQKNIERIAVSDTEHAKGAIKSSEKEFYNVVIPLSYQENLIVKAILTGKIKQTDDWKDLLAPSLSAESARFDQAGAGIAYSSIVPLKNIKPAVALVFSFYRRVSENDNQRQFIADYSDMVAQAIERLH